MLRLGKTYEKGKGSQHMTFRRLSKNSDPSSWIHGGITARNLFPVVAKEVEKLGTKMVEKVLNAGG